MKFPEILKKSQKIIKSETDICILILSNSFNIEEQAEWNIGVGRGNLTDQRMIQEAEYNTCM